MKHKKHRNMSPTQLARKQLSYMDSHKTKRHRDREELSHLIGRWGKDVRRAIFTHKNRDAFSRS